MDKRYEVYCLVDPHFYDSTTQVGAQPTDYELTGGAIPDGWQRAELDDWIVLSPTGTQLVPQGWKVHVSATLDNARDVLATTAEYCFAEKLAFKFLRSPDALLLANAKYTDRGSSGKFMAIYPADEERLERLLRGLDEKLAGSAGPYILSDLRYGAGPLYVRYGGFAERYCVAENGTLELAIEDPDGRLVPDRRSPTFRLPDWVQLPSFLEPHLEARNSVKVDALPYRVERALHFSNGGGLYVGSAVETGEPVVLKEARPYAGLDADGTDAVARLEREQRILERLAGLEAVPAVHGRFTVGEHHFLAIEFVDAQALHSVIVERFPLVRLDVDESDFAEYTRWALDIVDKVERAVASLHDRGVVVGDLHPFNVLLRPDGRVVLIDFEVASGIEEGRRRTLADPGFAAPRDATGFDVDRYSLACLRLFMFLPLTTLLTIDRNKAADLAAAITELFPVPPGYFDAALEVITGQPRAAQAHSLVRHRIDPELDGWEQIRDSLANGILASATPHRDDRLFPGDIEQFETGGLSIAYGAAGVLYALAVTGAGRFPDYEEWLVERATNPTPGKTRLGFYDGLHGVAHVLDHLGHRGEALKVLEICTTELSGHLDELGLDLYGGLAGIGLNLAHFAAVTGDSALRKSAYEVAEVIANRLGDADSVSEISGGTQPHAGLTRGSSGPALLFLRLYEQTGQPVLLDFAHTALRQDLRRCVVREDGCMEVNEGWRTMPYLADGSVGIGVVLEQYLAHRHEEQFADAAARIRRAAESQFYVEPGLLWGRAGIILYLAEARRHGGDPQLDALINTHIRRLAWHAMDYQGHAAFPGAELLRLSMDLGTGSAGVLLAIGAALHDEPVSLPLLAPTG